MAERDAVEEADRLERVKTLLRRQFEEESFTSSPWFDATALRVPALYGMRVLDGPEWRWARPAVSLEEFLRCRALGK